MQSTMRLCVFLDRYIRSCLKRRAKYLRRAITNRDKYEAYTDDKTIEWLEAKRKRFKADDEVCSFDVEGFRIEVKGDMLCRAMTALPEGQRKVLLLYYWEEISFTEVAELLGISRKTVYNEHRAALAAMRSTLNELEGNP